MALISHQNRSILTTNHQILTKSYQIMTPANNSQIEFFFKLRSEFSNHVMRQKLESFEMRTE